MRKNLHCSTALTSYVTKETVEYHARMEELYQEYSDRARFMRRMTWSTHNWDSWDPVAEEECIRAQVCARMTWERNRYDVYHR